MCSFWPCSPLWPEAILKPHSVHHARKHHGHFKVDEFRKISRKLNSSTWQCKSQRSTFTIWNVRISSVFPLNHNSVRLDWMSIELKERLKKQHPSTACDRWDLEEELNALILWPRRVFLNDACASCIRSSILVFIFHLCNKNNYFLRT